MTTPCFQHDSYRHDCGDCRDMSGDDLPVTDGTNPVIVETHETFKADATYATVLAEMDRIRAAIAPASGDKEDLITYAKEVVGLRAAPPANPAIERVARAIYAACQEEAVRLEAEVVGDFDTANEHEREFSRLLAQAALEAMPDVVGLREWALEKSSLHHRLATENEHLRTEHIASSSAYREIADHIAALAKVSGVSNPLPDSPPRS
jgi:hypothetical protein